MNLKEFLMDWRISLWIAVLIISIILIHPNFVKGAYITYSNIEGIKKGDIIVSVNGIPVKSSNDFYKIINEINPNESIRLGIIRESFLYIYSQIYLPPLFPDNLEIDVTDVPFTNLKFGLDIEGGARVLLKPKQQVSTEEIRSVVGILEQRLNIYGLKEVTVSHIKDFSGNNYIKIEMAGTTVKEIEDLLSKQGKFEAKIGNETVFTGDDVVDVCMTGVGCGMSLMPVVGENNKKFWRFEFQVFLTKKAAEKFANITSHLSIGECTFRDCYLNETIDFYLDGKPIEGGQLKISSSLKGKVVTSPSISGYGATREEAEKEMRRLQAILQTRNLPVELEIVEESQITPILGTQFLSSLFKILIIAAFLVSLVVFVRYRDLRVALPIILIVASEIVITLGIASLIKWTLDLASLAGLIAGVGTGVDDQVVIADEIVYGKKKKEEVIEGIKEKIKKAFFVIFTSYFASVAAMIPLGLSTLSLFRGFAITTIISITVGVMITRPAFARILEHLLKR